MKRKKIISLVTGGSGFIGSHVVDLLISKNHEVRIIDDLSGGNLKNINHHFKNKNLKFKKLDINKLKSNEVFFKNVDHVYHFAGKGDIVPSIENPILYATPPTINPIINGINKYAKYAHLPAICFTRVIQFSLQFGSTFTSIVKSLCHFGRKNAPIIYESIVVIANGNTYHFL